MTITLPSRLSRLSSIAALTLLLGACGTGVGPSGSAPASTNDPVVQAWITTSDQTRLLAREADTAFGGGAAQALNIDVDASKRYQRMAGFGASITDASAYLIQQRLSETQRKALLEELFGRGPNGAGFDFTRLTIGASDFSRTHYSLDDMPAGQTDMALAKFSIEPDRAVLLPVLKQALAINPKLQVMASPWSAPGWMKTTDSLVAGSLKPAMYGAFAEYMTRYVEAYAAEGVNIFALTLQNEPHFEPPDYPGMRVDPAARAALIGEHLGPLLQRRGLKTQLIEWDHNWDDPQAPLATLADTRARPLIAGVAWHCYSGVPSAQSIVHDAYPDKDVWFTECSGGEWAPRWSETLPWMMRNVVIGTTRNWARGVLMWNLALDENHGPHLGGCKDCRGVVTIDSKTGAVTRNLEYYALAHASRFVRPGAERIDSSTAQDGLDNVAFRNADDGSIALVVCNSAPQARRFTVRQNGRTFSYELPASAVVTFSWRPTN